MDRQSADISHAKVRTVTGPQPLHAALDTRVISVDTLECLRRLSSIHLKTGVKVWVDGYHTPGDGGGGLFSLVTETGEQADDIIYVTGTGQKLWRRDQQGFFTSAQAGIRRDGTREDKAIQKAINVAFDRKLRFHLSPGAHTHGSMIVIPHDTVITGSGMHESFFYNDYLDSGQRGVIVGTYGPANSYIPAYHPEHVYALLRITENRLYLNGALDFKLGDIIGIEGNRRVRDTNLYSPNQINEVVGVNKDHIVLKYSIDDDYHGGRAIRLNQPKLPKGNTLVDATGRKWNLHVSVNTRITDVGFRQKAGFRWPAVNLSTYKTVFENCSFGSEEGYTAVSGNPVARTSFNNCEFLYSRNAWEFAYYSHDTEITGPSISRSKGAPPEPGDYVCHANTSEGAKRIHITGGHLNDGGPSDSGTTALQTGPESSVRNFTINTFGRGVWGDAFATMSGCTITWGQEFGIAGFSHGYANGNVIVSQEEAKGASIIVDKGEFHANVLRSFDGSKRSVDVLRAVNRHQAHTDEDGNKTFKSTPIFYSAYSNSLDAMDGQVVIGSLEVPVGSIANDSIVIFETMIELPTQAKILLLVNGTTIHELDHDEGTVGLNGKIIFASGNGMDDKYCRLFMSTTTGLYQALSLDTGIAWAQAENIELKVAGLQKQALRRHYIRIERRFDMG